MRNVAQPALRTPDAGTTGRTEDQYRRTKNARYSDMKSALVLGRLLVDRVDHQHGNGPLRLFEPDAELPPDGIQE